MQRNQKKEKTIVREVKSKVKIIEKAKEESELEEEIESGRNGFSARGLSQEEITPILKLGEIMQDNPSVQEAARAQTPRTASANTETEARRTYSSPISPGDDPMKYATPRDPNAMVRPILQNSENKQRRTPFENQELANMRNQENNDDKYETKIETTSEVKRRKYPWEV